MDALDPELSNAPIAVKIEFYELNFETPRKLQSRVSETNSSCGDISLPVGLHVPPQRWLILRRLFLRCHLYSSLLPDFYTDGGDIQRGNKLQLATILGILLQRNVATATSVAPTRASGRFPCTWRSAGQRNRIRSRTSVLCRPGCRPSRGCKGG